MSAGAFDDDGDAVIEMDLLPPRWLDIQDEVAEHLSAISVKMKKLEQLHQKHVLPGFDDEEVKKREEREIESMTQDITRGFQSCQKAIRRIDVMVKEADKQGNLGKGEETMAQNLKISLATRAGDVSALFRKKQTSYMKSKDTCHQNRNLYTDLIYRTSISGRHKLTFRPILNTHTKSVHRPIANGLRDGPFFGPVDTSPN